MPSLALDLSILRKKRKRRSNEKKILLADPSSLLMQEILQFEESDRYLFETARDGVECVNKIANFEPDLILIDLLLPEKHGIRILQQVKSDPKLKSIGVIITTDQILLQNYRTSVEHGASYFLIKPFAIEELFLIFEKYFSGKLHPDPFTPPTTKQQKPHSYPQKDLQLKFWGTRGSHSVCSSDFERYGGNSCCLEVRHKNDSVIIDAGTGIHALGHKLSKEKVKKINLFISHTHLDHIIGFPFFEPIYDPEVEITIWGPIGFEQTLQEAFQILLKPCYFPIGLSEVSAKITFKEIDHDTITIGSLTIKTHYTYHPGATLGFKIETSEKKVAYITDNELFVGYIGDPKEIDIQSPLLDPHRSLLHFIQDCDAIIHEAQYRDDEYPHKVAWGHSCISNATAFIQHTRTPLWIVTHHDPNHRDKGLDLKLAMHYQRLDNCQMNCRLFFAHDNLEYSL